MRYFVIGDDGQKYGPADLDLLTSWITEGRLLPTQQLEDESSGLRLAAGAVQGLNFPLQNPQSAAVAQGSLNQPPTGSPYAAPGGQPYQAYPRANNFSMGDDGSGDIQKAYIYAVVGLLCCLLGFIPAFIFLGRGTQKGNSGAATAKIVVWVLFGVWALAAIFQIVNFVQHGPTIPSSRFK